MRAGVPPVDPGAPLFQLADLFVADEIGAGHLPAEIKKQMPQAAHATTARADQMDARTGSGAVKQFEDLIGIARNHDQPEWKDREQARGGPSCAHAALP